MRRDIMLPMPDDSSIRKMTTVRAYTGCPRKRHEAWMKSDLDRDVAQTKRDEVDLSGTRAPGPAVTSALEDRNARTGKAPRDGGDDDEHQENGDSHIDFPVDALFGPCPGSDSS